MDKEHTTCNYKSIAARPILTLKPRPDACPYDPFWNQEQKIRNYLAGKTEEQPEVRELSRQLAAKREFLRKRAADRQDFEERRRLAADHAKAVRAERKKQEQEYKLKRWHNLLRQAIELGLRPNQNWTESVVKQLIAKRKAELLAQEERLRRQLVEREVFEDQFEHIPRVVKFGDFVRGEKSRYGRGDLASFNRVWRYHGSGRPAHKQRRTWEAAAPHSWRRKDFCDARWDQLL